jgi:hypothetical protein
MHFDMMSIDYYGYSYLYFLLLVLMRVTLSVFMLFNVMRKKYAKCDLCISHFRRKVIMRNHI